MVENNNTVSSVKKFLLGSISRWLKSRLPLLLLLLGVLLGAGAGLWVYQNNVAQQKDSQYEQGIKDKVAIAATDDKKTVVQQFGTDKEAYSKELQSSNSSVWDKAKLDKAYFNLLYADKVGSFNDVYSMLFFIDTAKRSGLDIDDNSYGIKQQQRDEIKARADKLADASKQGVSGQ